MKKLDILLQKRSKKVWLYILAELFFAFTTLSFMANMLTTDFSWFKLIAGLLFLFGAVFVAKGLYEYYTYGEVHLVAESDGNKITFYNTSLKGKVFNKTDDFDLTKMGKFYIVKKRTRYMMHNYAYAFEEKGSRTSLLSEEVAVFPSLYEATAEDRNNVLVFVKDVCPGIELNYENMWQKIGKK